MTSDYRHHRVSREIIFVPVPVAGSPAPLNQAKPPRYPVQHHQPWRPAHRPPSKAAATVRLLRSIAENEMAAREMLTPQALRRG
jgi:hypothetical protein